MLKDMFISKTRVKLLENFLSDPTQMYHVRDLVRKTGEEINAVRRELARMELVGMVKKEPRGNRLYYWFRHDYIYFADLLSLVAKTTGLGAAIIKNKNNKEENIFIDNQLINVQNLENGIYILIDIKTHPK